MLQLILLLILGPATGYESLPSSPLEHTLVLCVLLVLTTGIFTWPFYRAHYPVRYPMRHPTSSQHKAVYPATAVAPRSSGSIAPAPAPPPTSAPPSTTNALPSAAARAPSPFGGAGAARRALSPLSATSTASAAGLEQQHPPFSTLAQVLAVKAGRTAFLAQLQREFAVESFEFYEEVEQYQRIVAAKISRLQIERERLAKPRVPPPPSPQPALPQPLQPAPRSEDAERMRLLPAPLSLPTIPDSPNPAPTSTTTTTSFAAATAPAATTTTTSVPTDSAAGVSLREEYSAALAAVRQLALGLYDKYIRDGAPFQINIAFEIAAPLHARFELATAASLQALSSARFVAPSPVAAVTPRTPHNPASNPFGSHTFGGAPRSPRSRGAAAAAVGAGAGAGVGVGVGGGHVPLPGAIESRLRARRMALRHSSGSRRSSLNPFAKDTSLSALMAAAASSHHSSPLASMVASPFFAAAALDIKQANDTATPSALPSPTFAALSGGASGSVALKHGGGSIKRSAPTALPQAISSSSAALLVADASSSLSAHSAFTVPETLEQYLHLFDAAQLEVFRSVSCTTFLLSHSPACVCAFLWR